MLLISLLVIWSVCLNVSRIKLINPTFGVVGPTERVGSMLEVEV